MISDTLQKNTMSDRLTLAAIVGVSFVRSV